MHECLDVYNKYGMIYTSLYIGSSAYADDVVVMSSTQDGLQCMLNNAVIYYQKWRFTFSPHTSECMTFGETHLQNKSNSKRRTFRMGECQLEDM